MSITHNLIAVTVCASAGSQAQALLSVNVLQDNTTLPGWVINTFTVDSDSDVTVAVALSNLSSGSMLQVPGLFSSSNIRSHGPGDSYISINNDPFTSSGLEAGDLTTPTDPPPVTFDSTGIGMAWFNNRQDDIGLDMHLAALTFSDDAVGGLELWVLNAGNPAPLMNLYSLDGGFFSLTSSIPPPPLPDPPIDPDPLPDPDPDPDPGNDPPDDPGQPGTPTGDGRNNPIPEPAGLGLFGLSAALIGGLHRRRLGAGTK